MVYLQSSLNQFLPEMNVCWFFCGRKQTDSNDWRRRTSGQEPIKRCRTSAEVLRRTHWTKKYWVMPWHCQQLPHWSAWAWSTRRQSATWEVCRLWTSRRQGCQQDCPRCLVSCWKQIVCVLWTLFCQFDTKSQHLWCWRKIIQSCDVTFFCVSHTPDVSAQLIMKHPTHTICCRLSLAPNKGGVCKTDHSARPSAHPTQHTTS